MCIRDSLHTYAIMRLYGDQIYEQNVDVLFDKGKEFSDMVRAHDHMELALEPKSNIVCFRYTADGIDVEEVNRKIADRLLADGTYYVVSTAVKGSFYLRITLMNPFTEREQMEDLIEKIQRYAVE